ncbi:hypothetical protein quinque_008372 [Culex quinquefasciatus]
MTGRLTSLYRFVDRSAASRWEGLVNSDQFADVIFRVGEPGELMYGHKAILVQASRVFRTLFGEAPPGQAIPIGDIEPVTFRELLRYMYADRITVTLKNAVDVLYGARKYQLWTLTEICQNYLRLKLTEADVLNVFEANRRYELAWVNRICLGIICDNPIQAFDDECFWKLSGKSVELIALRQAMNCRPDQLLTAIKKWMKINRNAFEEGTRIINFILKIDSGKAISIYGVGICIKSKKSPAAIELDITVERTSNGKLTRPLIAPMKRTVTAQAEDIHVEEVMFKKLAIGQGTSCSVLIQVTHQRGTTLYYYKGFEPEHPEVGLRFESSTGYSNPGSSCVAYVLYDDRK